MNKIGTRAGLFIVMTGAVILLPWWLSVFLLVSLVIYINNYIEVIFFGFLLDMLYSVKYPFPYIGLVISASFLIVVMFIRTRIRT